MIATTTVLLAVAMGGAWLLVAAGVGHIVRFEHFRATLISHDLIPFRWHRAVAATVVAVEIVVGLTVLTAGAVSGSAKIPALFGEALLYTAFLAYGATLRRLRPTASCGCFAGDGPVTRVILVRSGLVAVSAGTSAAAIRELGRLADMPLLLAAVGGGVIAVLARTVPAAFVSTSQTKEV